MLLSSRAFIAVAAILSAGCASAPTDAVLRQDRIRRTAGGDRETGLDADVRNRDVRETSDVPLPAVRAFDALPAAYASVGISKAAVVDNSGGVYTIGVRNLPAHGSIGGTRLSTYIDCGSGAMRIPANSYDVNLSVTTYVTPNGEGSTLHTMVVADARDPATNSPAIHCSSTGKFESRIAALVAGA